MTIKKNGKFISHKISVHICSNLNVSDSQNLPAFIEVPQLLILTTALQGLKGNLDMCLASRLCTQANLGNMKSKREITKMIVGNLALVQIQAIVAAVCLSLFGMGVGTINGNDFHWDRALLLAVSCMSTATSSCFILGKPACSLNID